MEPLVRHRELGRCALGVIIGLHELSEQGGSYKLVKEAVWLVGMAGGETEAYSWVW